MENTDNKLADKTKESDMKSLSVLLKNVGIILELKKNSQSLNQQIYDNFTIFTALGLEEKELKHCQIIYELINPEGRHGMGDKFLKLFFEKVFKEEYEPVTVIKSECDIRGNGNYGRIDLYIETANASYPIEVKINADDQETQIFRYNKFAKESNTKKYNVFYLTLLGKSPKFKSTVGMTEEEISNIKLISFSNVN